MREGDGGTGGGGFAPAEEEHEEDGALGEEAMADESGEGDVREGVAREGDAREGDAPLAGDIFASTLWDLNDGEEDFEDLTAVGAYLLRQLANNVVVELPGSVEGVVFAPLHFALGASRRLWTSSLDVPFAEILRASDFVAFYRRLKVTLFLKMKIPPH